MEGSQRTALIAIAVALAASGAVIGVWFGYFNEAGTTSVPRSEGVASVLAHTSRYVDRRVTIHGTVNGELTARAATLGGDVQQESRSLLVVSYGGVLHVRPDESVNVVGTVERFSLRRFSQNAGPPGAVNGPLLQAFAGRPTIVAAKVVRVPPSRA